MGAQRAVVTVDADGLVTAWNATATTLFGHGAEDVLGRDVVLLVPDALREAHLRGFHAAMAGGPTRLEGRGAHLPVRCADGEVRTFPARFTVLRDAEGAQVGATAAYGPSTGAAPFTAVGPAPPVPPKVRRVVANLPVADPGADAPFWSGLLGLDPVFDLGWVVALQAGTAQVQLVSRDATAPEDAAVSVEVDGLEALAGVHDAAVRAGHEIVHPLTDEPWGVRRFFVRTPQGVVVNVLAH